jgi:hypothetical protein
LVDIELVHPPDRIHGNRVPKSTTGNGHYAILGHSDFCLPGRFFNGYRNGGSGGTLVGQTIQEQIVLEENPL